MFVLYGNVRDLAPIKRGDAVEFLPMRRFLSEALFGKRDLIIMYDRGGGLSFADPAMQQDFQRALSAYDSFHGTNLFPGPAAQPRRRAQPARQLPARPHSGWQEDRADHRFRGDHAPPATSPACRPRTATRWSF